MKRVVVFAHYDKNNIIQDYVLYYLKELKKVVDNIIFVSDSYLQDEEIEKIKDDISFSIIGKHNEYDFGSYKRGYIYAKENGLLENCDELIFANDSCYAPLFPFEEMTSKMSSKEVDFWGVTANPYGIVIVDNKVVQNKQEHIQSYFIVFKPIVFKSEVFDKFIKSIKKEATKEEIIAHYEVGMSKLFLDNGFKYDVYCELSKHIAHSQILAYDRLIEENRSPFIKRSILLLKNLNIAWPISVRKIIKKSTKYNYELIKKDCRQNIAKGCYIKYIFALRKFLLRIHVKEERISFLGKWYSIGRQKEYIKKILNNIFSIKKDEVRNKKIIKICGIKIKLKRSNENKKELLTFLEKDIIANSPFWDALWYNQKYGHNFTREEALNYWYKTGWKKGESPSKYINIEVCGKFCRGLNPIIAYQSRQFAMLPDNKNNYKEENDFQKIKDYLEYKQTRKAKSVVYTCITNDYDDLREIETYKYVDKDWDYVCFSDNEEMIKQGQVGIWEVRPLQFNELDNTRNQRWHKTHPHLLFPNYEESVWADGNINILTNKLYETIKNTSQNILVPKHFKNLCIYTEYQDVINAKLDNKNFIKDELSIIKTEGMPANFGFAETNILFRKHHNKTIVKCMDMWWDFINKYSKRDQLAFTYVLWKHEIKPADINISNTRLDIENYYVFGHKKGR